jgi:hypothetical protein
MKIFHHRDTEAQRHRELIFNCQLTIANWKSAALPGQGDFSIVFLCVSVVGFGFDSV